MVEKLKLIHPLQINSKTVSELTYDLDEISSAAFVEAESKKAKAGKNGNMAGAAEIDYGLHLYLGFAAIIAINPDIDYSDLERIKGRDVMEVMKAGRNFIISSSEEQLPDEPSNEP